MQAGYYFGTGIATSLEVWDYVLGNAPTTSSEKKSTIFQNYTQNTTKLSATITLGNIDGGSGNGYDSWATGSGERTSTNYGVELVGLAVTATPICYGVYDVLFENNGTISTPAQKYDANGEGYSDRNGSYISYNFGFSSQTSGYPFSIDYKNKSYYEENYAHLGFEKEYNQKSKSLFKPYAYNVYNFYASGRVFIQWMLITVSLKKRHDLVSIVTSFFYFGERDRVTYLSSVVPTNDVPVVFCLCKKVYAKTLQKKYSEISDFTEVINLSFMNDSLVMMTENFDFVDKLFREKTLRDMYLKIEPYLDTIFFSDRRTFVKDEYGLMVIFDISSIPNEEVLKDITLFTHMIIDGLAVGSVKVQYKKEANDRRKKFDVKRTREEEYEKRYKQKIEESQKKNMVKWF